MGTPKMGISADPPPTVASHSCVRKPVEPTEEKEEEEMNHYMDFDPYLIRERNEKMRREVDSLRLEERLRKERNPRSSRVATLIKRGRLLIGGPRLASGADHPASARKVVPMRRIIMLVTVAALIAEMLALAEVAWAQSTPHLVAPPEVGRKSVV